MLRFVFGVFACFALFAGLSPARGQVLPVETFAADPAMAHVVLSPDGRRLAYTSHVNGAPVVVVKEISSGAIIAADTRNFRTHGLRWADNRHVLVTASDVTAIWGARGDYDFSTLVALDADDEMDSRQLLRRSNRLGLNLDVSRIIGIEAESGHLLIPARDDNRESNLLAVDPVTGNSVTAARGARDTRDWVVNARGEPVARLDYNNDRDRQILRIPSGSGWSTISRETGVERPRYSFAGLLPDGRLAVTTLMIPSDPAQDSRRALYSLSLETGELDDVVFQHARFDIEDVLIDPYSNLVVGVSWIEDFERVHWFDERLAAHQVVIDGAMPDWRPQIVSWTPDFTRLVVRADNPATPPVYFLYDVAQRSMDIIGASHPDLTVNALQARQHITYQVSDGATLEAYLTRPDGDGPFPTVILPHGGPESRDKGGFDYFAHFLTSRGYAVVQPNFRGSSGYGYRWMEAGYGQWGTGVMQHDLTDTVERLVTAGIADPDRVCIVGASYGGYAALAGAAFTPDTYRCAVAIAGVSDTQEMLNYTRQRYGRSHWFIRSWMQRIAQGEDNVRAALRAASPTRHADSITIPVLLIHGRDDTVVPIEQSQFMRRAISRAGGDVELITIDDGDHWLTASSTRQLVLTELETFLATHLGE
ncbi:alpha/beta hydrolase family protein [Maricaulis maris]|uniref:Dipeptidyl aminopeptidase/acylaminoacyl peptidase n=1 Tax=Maricaulis maris TaxID=74318 RepID=A0A495DEY5_9PROT|nr:alpha/beta fold hydrolase [Maricaulis maris]RKR00096.1 dipeptidyl aminopeptidase/acylaminoacyl peptidase [Maricaulis maris]